MSNVLFLELRKKKMWKIFIWNNDLKTNDCREREKQITSFILCFNKLLSNLIQNQHLNKKKVINQDIFYLKLTNHIKAKKSS